MKDKKQFIKHIHPRDILEGKNLEVFQIVDYLLDELMEMKDEVFYQTTIRKQIDPIITCIVDQNRSTSGGPTCLKNPFSESRRYFVFINNFEGKGYIELELGMYFDGNRFYITDFDFADHGWPASYGYDIYNYDPKTGEQKFDETVFRI